MISARIIQSLLIYNFLVNILCASDQIPGAAQKKPIAIVGGTLHTISGNDIAGGTILLEAGRITQIGLQVALPVDVEIIPAEGKHIYPGLIEANSDIGLVEINSIRASIDSREIGNLNSNVRAAVAFNPDSELIPVARANGILSAVSAPSGGLVAGRSALMLLDGWTREDMLLKADAGLYIRWPATKGGLEELTTFFDQAQRYAAVGNLDTRPLDDPRDLRLESMKGVLEGTVPIVVSVDELAQIQAAVSFQQRYSIRMIIAGGTDAVLCAELLKSHHIPVIVTAVYSNPARRHSPYDDPYTLPKRLQAAGIQYCISAGGRFGANGIRNLPYNAATAAAFGLTPQEALRAITLSPAEILGVSDRIGSLQIDRDATLFVADGDILETPTQVEMAFIQGRSVDLTSRHTQLYRKYTEKYQQQTLPAGL